MRTSVDESGRLVDCQSEEDSLAGASINNCEGAIHSRAIIRQAARAGKALVARQILVYGVNIVGSIILARILSPRDFGFYGIVLFAITFLGIFGGTGFAANLIRIQEEPSIKDLRVVFTAQQAMVAVVFVGIWAVAPILARLYHISQHGEVFFWTIGAALVMTSFMVIPQIKMERDLAFDKLAFIEVCQTLVFNMCAILLAWKGWGALSFSTALLIRATTGALLANWSMPWRMGLEWDTSTLFRHLQFGVALQAGQFAGVLKDSISPIFVGMLLGAVDVGYVTWATSLAAYAVWILMPIQRIYLPFFARLQHDKVRLQEVVSFVLWMVNGVAAPFTMITLALSRPITSLIFGDKWLTALPLFYLFSLGNIFIPCSTPMMGLLNSLGQSRKTLLMSVIWMGTTWLLGVPCILEFGLLGFGYAMLGVQLSNLLLFLMVRRTLRIPVIPTYWPSWPIAGVVALAIVIAQFLIPVNNLWQLSFAALAGIAIYTFLIWRISPNKVGSVVSMLRSSL